MSLVVRKLIFLHVLHRRSGGRVTTYQSDLATKKLPAPKRKDDLDREKGLQMRNAAVVTHAS